MHNLLATIPFVHIGALYQAINASIPTKIIGVTGGILPTGAPQVWTDPNTPVTGIYLNMADTAQPADDATAQNIATAHDPIYLTVDRTSIPADNSTPATVTVRAPKSGAAAVTLSIASPGGQTVTQLVTMVAGVGTVAITSPISGAINVSVQNPSNRSTDTITIQAV